MRLSIVSLGLVAIVVSILSVPCPALAEDEEEPSAEDKAEAKKRFETGKALMKKETYEVAASEFKASIRLYPTKNALYNLSQCYMAVQMYDEALLTLEELENQFGQTLDEEMRASVEADKKKILGQVAAVEIEVDQSEAMVTVDGKEVGKSPLARPAIMKPGKHTVEVSLDGHPAVKRQLFVDAGEKRSESFELMALPPEPEPEPAAPVAEAKKPINLKNTLFWVGVGGTVATGVLAGIFWGLAASSYSDLKHNNGYIKDMYEDDPELPEVLSLAETARDKASRYNKLGVGFTVVAVLFAAGTATLVVSDYYGWNLFGSEAEVALHPNGVAVRF